MANSVDPSSYKPLFYFPCIFSDGNVPPKHANKTDRKKKKIKVTNTNQLIATIGADAIDNAAVCPATADTEQNKGECHVDVNNANSGHLKKIMDLRCFQLIFYN